MQALVSTRRTDVEALVISIRKPLLLHLAELLHEAEPASLRLAGRD